MATKTKRKQIEQNEAIAILDSVKDINVSEVISGIGNVQITIQKVLADVASTVTTKVHQVNELDQAIELKNQKLKDLFNIETDALSLEETRAQREKERLEWDLYLESRRKKWDEEESELLKSRNRNEDNWKYEFEQKKKRILEEFEAEVARAKRNETIRHETLELSWVEREKNLKAKEQELQNLQTEAANFETRLAEATKKGEGSGFASATAKYTHEIALLKKDAESDKKVAEMKIVALASQISGLENQIEELQKQLSAARQDAKEVASEALKSASSRQLADTLQKVVTETQQSTGKSK